jgi:hypothetical protein
MTKISLYIKRLLRPRGKDFADVSVDDGVGGYDSRSISGELLENVLAEHIGLDCQVVTGSPPDIPMTLTVDGGVSMEPVGVSIKSTAGGKGTQDIVLQIGSFSGGNDIMPPTRLIGFFQDAVFEVSLEGAMPDMLSDSAVYYLQVVVASSGANVVDVKILGNQFDV